MIFIDDIIDHKDTPKVMIGSQKLLRFQMYRQNIFAIITVHVFREAE